MTPDDVAAIRAKADAVEYVNGVRRFEILALCDALEAAWSERDARYTGQELKLERINRKNAEKRAERAEADAREARAEATFSRATENAIGTQNIAYRAALARVREYADEIDGGILAPAAREIRAAIEGP